MTHKTKMVRVLKGSHEGELAYVTYDTPEEPYIRVTPVTGDPLISLEVRRENVEYIWGAAHGG